MLDTNQPTTETVTFRDVFTVSRLNNAVRDILEGSFPLIWVEGEISNLARPSSGHIYFSLKDESAQVKCAMFRMRNMVLPFNPENGIHVLARAQVSLYPARGDYQLIVEHMEEAGDGALRRAFDQLKKRLSDEGLFSASHKMALPSLPRQIGVITSPTGAAIRDVLSILKRRFPAIPIVIYPVPVQGAGAAEEIAAMIRRASRRKDCDVLILTRGGGSLEDLWVFNEESVARAIFDCEIPLVSGVGHEIDITIADFAADQRAATPSAAAELVSPSGIEWIQNLVVHENRLVHLMSSHMKQWSQTLNWLQKRLQHPGQRLLMQFQRLDELEQRMINAQEKHLRHLTSKTHGLSAQLLQFNPVHRLRQLKSQYQNLSQRLANNIAHFLHIKNQQLSATVRTLESVSPLATLGRGYAIVRRIPEGNLLRFAHDVSCGDQVEAFLAKGHIVCRVEETHDDSTITPRVEEDNEELT